MECASTSLAAAAHGLATWPGQWHEVCARRNADDKKKILEDSQDLASISSGAAYDAIFVPGGHGVVVDMPDNEKLQAVLREAYEAGKVVSSVCHGPVCLVNVKLSSGKHLVSGKQARRRWPAACRRARARARWSSLQPPLAPAVALWSDWRTHDISCPRVKPQCALALWTCTDS